jgi:hypothetical protein
MATIDTIAVAGTGLIRLGVWSLDHCDPHVTCSATNGSWLIKIEFSFIHARVRPVLILPPNRVPPSTVINQLESVILAKLAAYRAAWWNNHCNNPASQTRGACCLNNQTVQGGTVQSATYNATNDKTTVALSNGMSYDLP